MNICTQAFVWKYVFISLEWILRSAIVVSCGNSMFRFLRNGQMVFQSGHTILHSHQQYRVLVSISFSVLIIIIITIICLFDYRPPSGCEVVSHDGFVCISLVTVVEHIFMWLLAIELLLNFRSLVKEYQSFSEIPLKFVKICWKKMARQEIRRLRVW